MSLKDELTKEIASAGELSARRRRWVPGVEWLGTEGTVTTDAVQGDPEWASILRGWDLDPDEFQIIEPVLFNSWGGEDGLNNRQFKAKVIRRVHAHVDLEPLIARAMKHNPRRREYSFWHQNIALPALRPLGVLRRHRDGRHPRAWDVP